MSHRTVVMRRKLYEIRDEVKNIFNSKEGVDPITGEISEEVISNLDDLDIEAKEKIHACSQKLRQIKSEMASAATEIKEIGKLKKSLENDFEKLVNYVIFNMVELGIDEIVIDGRKTALKDLEFLIEVDLEQLLVSAPHFVKTTVSQKEMVMEIKAHIKNGNVAPEGVKVLDGRKGLKI